MRTQNAFLGRHYASLSRPTVYLWAVTENDLHIVVLRIERLYLRQMHIRWTVKVTLSAYRLPDQAVRGREVIIKPV